MRSDKRSALKRLNESRLEIIKDIWEFFYDLVNLNSINIPEYIKLQKYTNSGNHELFGYPPDNICKAALVYLYYEKHWEFEKAAAILSDLKISVMVEELVNIYKRSIFKNFRRKLPPVSLDGVMSQFYSEFTGRPREEINLMVKSSRDIYASMWRQIVRDEDNVTPSQLGEFYNSLPFPVGSLSSFNPNANNLSIAYNALPVLIINSLPEVKTVFDFGGNIGEPIAAISNGCNVDCCMLIEENKTALNFAAWRDKNLGITGVIYKKESELEEDIGAYQQSFDFGICTEVLEHVFHVEETIATISRLLKKGGFLYFSASFGLYPRPSHLKKNTVYSGHEDELMAQHGMKRIDLDGLALPLLNNTRIYQKLN